MPELRRDPVVERWVVIAPERGNRPRDGGRPGVAAPSKGAPCPFCPGNESESTPEVYAVRPPESAPDAPGWLLRVVSNKFPALQGEGDPDRTHDGLHERMRGVGAHEVVIESPDHEAEWSDLPIEAAERSLVAYRARMQALAGDGRWRYLLVFKNQGPAAGASLEHGHAQLIATPVVPLAVREELDGAERYWRSRGSCVYCDLVAQERRDGRRLILDDGAFVAIAPFAPRVAFETWVIPAEHRASFEESDDATLGALARALREAIARLRRALDRPDYNYLIHSAPCRETRLPHYHWHVEIYPRLPFAAPFEWGTGIHIVTTPPEEAARTLREVRL